MTIEEKICGMKMYKLGDLCSDVVDCPHSTPEWKNEGIRVIRNFNIVNGSLDFSNGFFVDEETFEKRTQRACPEFEDLVISREAPMGAVCMIPKNLKCCLGQRLVLLKINKEVADPNYILFTIQSQFVQRQIQIIDQTGSIVSNLNIPDLKSLRIPLPSLPEQKKIASVLSALDDKIALNKKMNQKLEAMAKRLYDYWFVQYDFPDKNGHPYKTTGGPMTYNPTLKRDIPEGWKVDVVGNVCETVLGGTPSTENESFWNGNIPWLNSGEVAEFPILNAEKRITEDAVKNSATAYLPAGSVTLSITRHLRPSIMAIDACINQSVAGIKENDILKNGYLYPYLVNEIPRLNTLRGGAQQPHINKDTVDKSPIVIPAQNVLHQYYEKVNPLYKEIIEKAKESQKLTVLRDKLLPLLMNGQVMVR